MRAITHEVRVGERRILAIHEGMDFPGNRLFVEIMGPNRGLYGGAYIELEDARLIAEILLEWADKVD